MRCAAKGMLDEKKASCRKCGTMSLRKGIKNMHAFKCNLHASRFTAYYR